MYICKECNKEIKNKKTLMQHLKKYHNYTFNNYDEQYKFYYYTLDNIEIPKCEICKINDIYVNSIRGSHVCNNKECIKKYHSQIQLQIHKNNPQLAINARERRIKYLSNKNNFNSTAFGKRANKQLSFLEKWFIDNVINKYELTNKYLIINEYPITNENKNSAYVLDFAFINIKLDVELDGRCHFNNGVNRIQSDYKRDEYLLNNGWNIYRISFFDVENNSKETITKFINLLNENKFEYDESYYLRNKVITNKEFQNQYNKQKNKECIKEQNKIKKLKYKEEIRDILIDLEKNSNINFSKFGWVTKAIKYLQEKNIKITQLHRTLILYYPEFFENNKVFIRKYNGG